MGDGILNSTTQRVSHLYFARDLVECARKVIRVERAKARPNAFTIRYFPVCLKIATVLYKLDAMDQGNRDFDKDMKQRVEYRLSSVNQLESYDTEWQVIGYILYWRHLSEVI